MVGGPQIDSCHNGRSEQMNLDPSDAAAVEAASANELDYFTMVDRGYMAHSRVVGEEPCTATGIASEQFSVDQVVTSHFAGIEQPGHFFQVWRLVPQEPDPYRCVDQDHPD